MRNQDLLTLETMINEQTEKLLMTHGVLRVIGELEDQEAALV